MHRWPWGLACLTLTAAVAAVPASAAPCARRAGVWYVSTPPAQPRSTGRSWLTGQYSPVRAVAVDPADPRVVFVTDGAHLYRSDDAGCSWRLVYQLPAAPGGTTPDGDVGDIRSIDVARVGGKSRVLLAVEGAGPGTPLVSRPAIVRSDDGRTGWTTAFDATFAGTFDASRGPWAPVVHSAGKVAYAAVPAANGTVAYLRSTDGGATWTVRTAVNDPAAPVRLTGFAVNPVNPDELWEWGGKWSRDGRTTTALRRSRDGGATWTWVDPWPSYATKPVWSTADVAWPRKGGPARVMVLGEADDGSASTDSPVLAWSGDGGTSFLLGLPPLRMRLIGAALTHLANGDAVVVTTERLTFRVVHRGRPPARGDWRLLATPPEAAATATAGHDPVRASATTPAVVAVPTARTVQLLTVPK